MPEEEGEPTLPTLRAVRRVIQNTTGQEPDVAEPRTMRADGDDDFWQHDAQGAEPSSTPQTPRFGLPRELNFDEAAAAAREHLATQEEIRVDNHLERPDLPSYVPIWEQQDASHDDHRARPMWLNLVPGRKVNISVIRGERESANKISDT